MIGVEALKQVEEAARLEQAAELFIARRDRVEHPDGTFDSGGRWLPSVSERQACCGRIRSPSRAWPYSLLTHCRSAGHVAALMGVDASLLRKEVAKLEAVKRGSARRAGAKGRALASAHESNAAACAAAAQRIARSLAEGEGSQS